MKRLYPLSLFLMCVTTCSLFSVEDPVLKLEEVIEKGITVDLRNPCYVEGVLSTKEGGVITAPNVRIQATKIVYTKKGDSCQVEAEENLVMEFGNYLFVGDYLQYDFKTGQGVIYNGRTSVEPWFFGGEEVYLYPDGTYAISQAYVTTSQCSNPGWAMAAEFATLSPCRDLSADNVRFKICDFPVFWLPKVSMNLDSIFDNPIRYSFKWGGKQGPRIGMTYQFVDWNRWKAFLRFDYRLTRGPGLGLETRYRSEDRRVTFETINYAARDSSILDPHESVRYRFQGRFVNNLAYDNVSMDASWDKVSDIEMPTDYNDRGLELDIAGRTQFHIRQETPQRISNWWSRVRVNNFETVKQELPTLATTWHPLTLGESGIIFENKASASYLDFKYTKGLPQVHNYNSSRFEYGTKLYRPFYLNIFKLTAEVGGNAIYFGSTPRMQADAFMFPATESSPGERWVAFGDFSLDLRTRFTGRFDGMKHVVMPYATYRYVTFPTSSPLQHFIFDIHDGWYRLNQMRFGVNQNFYTKNACGGPKRAIGLDIYSFAFFDTPTLPQSIQKGYADLCFFTFDNLRHVVTSAWDFQRNRIDHFNFRTEWTIDANLAIAAEYRHRDAYDWRKVDRTNFILDSFLTSDELSHSALSDRRDTFLLHMFYRFHPSWALEIESRQGWNRSKQPNYSEYEVDLLGTLPSAWNLKVSYQHKQEDDRFALYVSLGIRRPEQRCARPFCLDF